MTVRRFFSRVLRRGVRPLLPEHYKLPFDYRLGKIASDHEQELRYLDRLGINRGTAIDIGANQGLFTYRLSQLYDRVIAFEINDGLTGELRAFAEGRPLEVIGIGLSNTEAKLTLHIPVKDGKPLYGWASLHRGNLPDADSYIKLPVSVRTLDSFKLQDVTFIKADVEGHEIQLLSGAIETIRNNRPVVLIEVKPKNRKMVHQYFNELDYSPHQLIKLTGFSGSDENIIFIPHSKI